MISDDYFDASLLMGDSNIKHMQQDKFSELTVDTDEPIYLKDKTIGITASGNYSFCFKKKLSFSYVNSGNPKQDLIGKNIYIEVEKKKYPVDILDKLLNNKNYKNE